MIHIKKNKRVIIILSLVFVVLAAIPTLIMYGKYRALSSQITKSDQKDDVKALVARVEKHILLPTGETPTVMTVTDKDRLSGQLFFANAKNGYKVLVYVGAKKAFLYDPVADRVIEVGPVLNSLTPTVVPQTSPTPTKEKPSPTPQVSLSPEDINETFLLLNGTTTAGLTKKVEQELLKYFPEARVADTDVAKKRTYEKSLLVDMTGKKNDIAKMIVQKMNLTLTELPSTEATSGGKYDFLIIVGEDKK